MLTIEEDDSGRIARKHRDRRDPLGIGHLHEGDVEIEHVERFTSDMLAGRIPVPAGARRIDIDPIARALLEHLGADPHAVAAIASAAGGVGICGEDGERIAVFETADGGTGRPITFLIHLEDDLTSYGSAGLRVRGLPDTVLAAAPGMALKSLVSHTALDKLDIVIVAVEEGRSLRIALRSNGDASE